MDTLVSPRLGIALIVAIASAFFSLIHPTNGLDVPAIASAESNPLQLTFSTRQLCHLQPQDKAAVTKQCLFENGMLVSNIVSQCSNLTARATSATRAVCNLLQSDAVSVESYKESLAAVLGSDLNPISVCISAGAEHPMKKLLQAISQTESRDPRDSKSMATNLLNICFSSCKNPSTAMLLGLTALSMSPADPTSSSKFCTNPAIALMWQHANNSPRECFDAIISSFNAGYSLLHYNLSVSLGQNVTPCVLQTLLPTYVALCDDKAIHCEESILSTADTEFDACTDVIEANATCSSQCAALVNTLSSNPKCLENMRSIQETVAHTVNATCAASGAFVRATSTRRNWRAIVPVLNAKCNPVTPFPLDLPHAQAVLDDAWSARMNSTRPAAFHVSAGDSRLILREVTLSSTLVFTASFNFTTNLSDHSKFSFGQILTNLTSAFASGLEQSLRARPGSLFVLSTQVLSFEKPGSYGSQVISMATLSVMSLNTSEQTSFDAGLLSDHTISVFHSIASSIEVRNLVSPATIEFYGSKFQYIPALRNPQAVFEFSASPLLLQRMWPSSVSKDHLFANASWLGFPPLNATNVAVVSGYRDQTEVDACKIDTFGAHNAGTLYAGDGILIQQEYGPWRRSVDCVATLRYPRSSFGRGSYTFLWSRVQRSQQHFPQAMFRPDATHNVTGEESVEYGRILVDVSGSHGLYPEFVRVTDEEIFLNIKLESTEALTLFAARRFKIESWDVEAVTRLVPMQPNVKRSVAASAGFFASHPMNPKPVDFSCAEIDVSAMPYGTRAVVSIVSSGGSGDASSVMTALYPQNDELSRPVPEVAMMCTNEEHLFDLHPRCSDYYRHGLYRQHTNSSAFRSFSFVSGSARLLTSSANFSSIFLACVSASSSAVDTVLQDSVLELRYQRRGMKLSSSCSSGPYTRAPSLPSADVFTTQSDTEAPVVVFSSIVTEFDSHEKKVVVSILLEDSSSFQFVYLDYKTSRNDTLRCSNWQDSLMGFFGTPQYVFGNQSRAFYKWSCLLPFKVSNGEYSIHIHAVDRALNSLYQELGYFNVTGAAAAVGDNQPPIVASSSISRQITSPGQSASISVEFQDTSGLSGLFVVWNALRNNQFVKVCSCFGMFGGIGNTYTASFTCSLRRDDGTDLSLPNGQYFLHAEAFDNNGNFLNQELASLNITGSTEDYDAPILNFSSISPPIVTPGQTIDVLFRLEDSSDFQTVILKLKSPRYEDVYCSSASGPGHVTFLYPVPVPGAVYKVSCILPSYFQYTNGRYSVEIEARDRSFNRLNAQLGTFDLIGGIQNANTLSVSKITLSQTASPGQMVLVSFELQDPTGFQFVLLSWKNLNGHELQCLSTGRTLAPVSRWGNGTGALYNDYCTLPNNAAGSCIVHLSAFDRNGNSLFRELGNFSSSA